MCSSGAIVRKAGANANSTAIASGALLHQFSEEAESYINVASKLNFTDLYSTLNDDVKKLLDQTSSDMAASYLITYDMSGYTNIKEATTMLDFYRDRINQNIELLSKEGSRVTIVSPTTTD